MPLPVPCYVPEQGWQYQVAIIFISGYPVKFSQLVTTHGCRVRQVTRTNTIQLHALVEMFKTSGSELSCIFKREFLTPGASMFSTWRGSEEFGRGSSSFSTQTWFWKLCESSIRVLKSSLPGLEPHQLAVNVTNLTLGRCLRVISETQFPILGRVVSQTHFTV